MKKENAFLQKLDKIGNLTQVVCLSLFLTGVSVQGVSAETGFPISQSVQQTKTVTGQVVDETGEPVIGASVVVEGTTNGTITDFDGRFALQVPSGKKVVISFVGYVPQTIAPKQGKDFRVVLKEDSKMLDEVVVVGYGTQKAKDVTRQGKVLIGIQIKSTASACVLHGYILRSESCDFYVAVSSGINRHFFLFATLAESQSHFDLLIGIGDLKSELCSFCSGKGTQRKAKYHDGF